MGTNELQVFMDNLKNADLVDWSVNAENLRLEFIWQGLTAVIRLEQIGALTFKRELDGELPFFVGNAVCQVNPKGDWTLSITGGVTFSVDFQKYAIQSKFPPVASRANKSS